MGNHQATPQAVVDYAARVFFNVERFALDAAASEWNAKADRFYTEADNGLIQPWDNPTWCNLPWATIPPWIDKITANVDVGNAALLLPARMGQRWVEQLWRCDHIHELRFVQGRIKFDPPPGEEKGPGGFEDVFFAVRRWFKRETPAPKVTFVHKSEVLGK